MKGKEEEIRGEKVEHDLGIRDVGPVEGTLAVNNLLRDDSEAVDVAFAGTSKLTVVGVQSQQLRCCPQLICDDKEQDLLKCHYSTVESPSISHRSLLLATQRHIVDISKPYFDL